MLYGPPGCGKTFIAKATAGECRATFINVPISDILSTGVERPIQMNDLRAAIADTQPSTINWLKTVKNYVKYANQDGQYNEVETYLHSHRRL